MAVSAPLGLRHSVAAPGQGEFTVDTDRADMYGVTAEILEWHLRCMWKQGSAQLAWARINAARRGAYLSRLGTQEQQTAASAASEDDEEAFIKRFRFKSLLDPGLDGVGPVACAALAGNTKMLRKLAAAKADVNAVITRDDPSQSLVRGSTALMLAAYHKSDIAVLQCLLELRANLRQRCVLGTNALCSAAASGNCTWAAALIDLGLDPDEIAVAGTRPVHVASLSGQPSTLAVLLERRANPDGCGATGHSPLLGAVEAGSIGCCRVLLDHRADVNAVGKMVGPIGAVIGSGLRLMRWAGRSPSSGPIQRWALLEGSTAVMMASLVGDADIVELLLRARADLSVKNRAGSDALTLARLGSGLG